MNKHPLLDHFWKGIKDGKFVRLTDEQISKFVTDIFLKRETINELNLGRKCLLH